MKLKNFIRVIPDFPQQGISFKDITPLLNNPEAVDYALTQIIEKIPGDIDKVAGIEARGFLLGMLLAERLNVGFVPIRKPGKLPAETFSENYNLEYGSGQLEIHRDAIRPGEKVILHDDLLATGGTAAAACRLIKKTKGELVQCCFIVELKELHGVSKLNTENCQSLLKL